MADYVFALNNLLQHEDQRTSIHAMLFATIFVGALVFPIIHAQAPTPLSQAMINTYTRYTHYAAAIFCKADVVKDWTCGSIRTPTTCAA
jgi:hypothetical protein